MATPGKSAYVTPSLTTYGSVRNLTGGSSGNSTDSGTPVQNKAGNK